MAMRLLVAAMAAVLLLSGCATRTEEAGQMQHRLAQLTDVPLPRGYDVDYRRTVVFGDGDRWNGKLAYHINSSAADMFDFYRSEMPKLGWSEVSVFRAPTSVMTFTREGRVATVQIARGLIQGANVDMVVAPATAPAGAAGPVGAVPPAVNRNAPAYREPDSSTFPPASPGGEPGMLRPDEMPPPAQNRSITVEPVR